MILTVIFLSRELYKTSARFFVIRLRQSGSVNFLSIIAKYSLVISRSLLRILRLVQLIVGDRIKSRIRSPFKRSSIIRVSTTLAHFRASISRDCRHRHGNARIIPTYEHVERDRVVCRFTMGRIFRRLRTYQRICRRHRVTSSHAAYRHGQHNYGTFFERLLPLRNRSY